MAFCLFSFYFNSSFDRQLATHSLALSPTLSPSDIYSQANSNAKGIISHRNKCHKFASFNFYAEIYTFQPVVKCYAWVWHWNIAKHKVLLYAFLHIFRQFDCFSKKKINKYEITPTDEPSNNHFTNAKCLVSSVFSCFAIAKLQSHSLSWWWITRVFRSRWLLLMFLFLFYSLLIFCWNFPFHLPILIDLSRD